MTRSRLLTQITVNLVAYVVLYLFFVLVRGRDFANEYILETIAVLIIIQGAGFAAHIFRLSYHEIPTEIYNDQESDKQRLQIIADKKQAQINRLEKQVSDLENKLSERDRDIAEYDRKANAQLITLDSVEMAGSIGIEIFNGENRNPFDGYLWIIEVLGKRKYNPSKAKVGYGSETTFHIPPKGSMMVRVIDMGNPDIPSIDADGMNRTNFDESGEYTIRTRVEGWFLSPDTPASFGSEWKFIIDIESRKFDLILVKERVSEE